MEEQEADPATPPSESSEGAIALDSQVTIAGLTGLYQQLLVLIDTDKPIVLDGSGVERADAAALQLFCSLFRTAEVKGASCYWVGASDPLKHAARLCGLDSTLGLTA